MKEESSEYNEDLQIDKDALDYEWLKQSRLYMKWAELLAKANSKTRIAKEFVALTEAKMYSEIRKEAIKNGEKITEAYIKTQVSLSPGYKKAIAELNEAIYESDIFAAAVRAMEQKKSALENEVKLWIAGYFSQPVEPRGDSMALEGLERQRDETREKLNKRRIRE